MASNKKAQILAAVMCASSIFGSYTVVSAADTPTKIESTDKNSSVTANGSTITATAGAQGSQQSTITLGNKSLAINVGKQTTTDGITYGAFTLNSSNLAVNNSGLSVKNTKGIVVGSISNTGAITGTGLTIKNGTGTTLASLNNNGLNIYDGINTKATATITKAGAITGTGLTVKAVSDTIKPEGDYVESKVTTSGVADTIKQGGFTRATSNVTTNSIKDTIYTDGGTELSSINVFKNTAANGIENGKVSLTAKKIVTDNQTSTTTTSTLTLGGDNASLKVGNYGFTVDSNNNVLFSGKNASLTSTGLTVNGTGTSSIKSTNATTEAYTKNDISYNGMTTTARGGKNPSESDNVNKTTSAVTYTGVTDTVYDDGGNLKTKSSVTTSGITNTVNDVSTGKALANSSLTTSGISNTTTDLVMTGTNEGKKMSTALYQNSNGISASATKKGEDGATIGTSTLTLGGDSASLKVGNYGFAVDSNNNVSITGDNATLSGSTFTLKDATNGKTLASLGASGLSINNADGIKVGGISNTGNLIANDGMNVTDKNSSWVNIGTSTMQKDIVATTTTSYAGITNKIDTTLAGNKTYTSGTVVGPTSVTTTVQGNNTTDAISGNKNKTTSTVSATGVTDTVYNVKGNQVASSSVTTNGIVNTTTNLSIDGSTNNTMSTSIYQDKRGISASATKKDENGTVGTSTLTLAGNSASLKVGNYGFAVDSNNNVSIAGNNATLSGSTFTLKDANGKTATLNTSGLTLKDEDGNTTGGISTTGAITGTSLRITTSEDTNGNKTVSTVATNGVTDTVTNNKTNNKTTSQVSANGVTDTVYGTDGTTKVASSSVSTSGISNTTSLKTTTGKIDTAINQNTSGVGISSTKYDTNNNVTDKTSVSVNGGTSSITSYGNYIYGEDGKATSYNQASISLNGNTGTATIRGGSNTASSTLTLNEAGVALSGKNVGLNANGLTLYKDVDGVKTQYASLSTGGLSVNGTGYTTIKSTNATTGAIGQSQVSYNGVTDSFTKDDVTNSVTTNANGTTFSSTGNGSTTIKGDTIKTTNLIVNGKDIGGVATDVAGIERNTENEDGLGYYTQIEGKTKIYNTGRFSTANGNFVVDPYGSITSKAGNYRFNMDRTNGFDLGYAAVSL